MKMITIKCEEKDLEIILAMLKESKENGHIGENGFAVVIEDL